MNDIIERKEKCGDCLHEDVCEVITKLIAFNRNNPAYCKKFRNSSDVAPVRHGKWVKTKEPLGYYDVDCVSCSACNELWVADEDTGFDFLDTWNYCPNCGCKMDLEG